MKLTNNIEQLIRRNRYQATPQTYDKTLQRFMQAVDDRNRQKFNNMKSHIWRIIMRKPIPQLSVVILSVVVVYALIPLFDKSANSAYAIDQTISANHTVRTLHMRSTFDENIKFSESWLQYDEAGLITNCRTNIHDGDPNEDDNNIKIIVWNDGVQKIWLPLKNVVIIHRVNNSEEFLQHIAENYDPKLMMQNLHDTSQNNDNMTITIDESTDRDFIYVEVENYKDRTRWELLVDPDTKLVTQLAEHDLEKQGSEFNMRVEFLSYNQPIDPTVFTLNEMPDDVRVTDKTHELVGIKKEAMSDHEVAVEVVRQCLEATIAQDYKEVCRLMGGESGKTIESYIEEELGTRLVSVVSMGQPRPFKTWTHILYVPCEIEVENGEGTKWIVNFVGMARSIDYQPGHRWIMSDEHLEVDEPDHIVNEILGSYARGIIVPEVSVEDYQLGMSKDDVLIRRGEPKNFCYGGEDFTPSNLPKTYYMAYHDLWFFIQDGSVTGILIKKPFYRFTNGLKLGDSKENIIQTFGHDFLLIDSGSEYLLAYKDKGLSFGLNKDNNAINEITVYSPLFMINLYRQVSIGGTWEDSCQQVVQDGEVKHQKTTFNYLGDTVKIERIDYQDNNCRIKSSSLVFTGTFTVPRMSTTPGVRDIDYIVKSMTATFHTMAAVNRVNQMKYLGYSDWQVNVTKDITGAPGISSQGDKLYDIFRIDDGNKLYIGSNEAIGSSTRPTRLRRFHATRQ